MSCCPPNSWPELATDYKSVGNVTKVGDLEIYYVGKGPKCIIWNYDIFGFDSGRTRQLCDLFAKEGFLVVMPDFYRGVMCDPATAAEGTGELPKFIIEHTQWPKLEKDLGQVLEFAKEKGAQSIGTIGTCWGSYVVVRLSSFPELKAGVSMHPSHTPIASMILKENEKEILKGITCPQLFMPAGNDAAEVKPGGLGQEILGNNLSITEFPDMVHGWTTRGDMNKINVDRDVKKAISEALAFFKKHV